MIMKSSICVKFKAASKKTMSLSFLFILQKLGKGRDSEVKTAKIRPPSPYGRHITGGLQVIPLP